MIRVAEYDDFNRRRYSDPWIGWVNPATARIDFSAHVGGYTGARCSGEGGVLYITDPQEGAVYAYGQKDYRGNGGGYQYVQYKNGSLIPVEKKNLLVALGSVQ